jgi:hypothetical protein
MLLIIGVMGTAMAVAAVRFGYHCVGTFSWRGFAAQGVWCAVMTASAAEIFNALL